LLIWNAVTANKAQAIPLKSAYVMAVGMEQSRGNLVACGGLDNMCTVYPVSFGNHPDTSHALELASHDGFLSCCRFTSEQEIITSSGDSTCIQWDLSAGKPICTFAEHAADCMYLSLKPNDKHVFASCSVDQTVKIWDTRVGGGSGASPKKSVQSFGGHHTGDINCVEFMPCNGNAFATCSQDSTVRLFDLRAYNQLNKFSVTPTTAATMAAMAAAAAEGGGGDVEGDGGMEGGGGDDGDRGGNGDGGKPTDASLNKAPAVVPASQGEGDDDAESGDDGVGGGGEGKGGDNQANKAAARAAAMEDFEEEVGYDAFTSLAFSGSGRLIFCGHADGSVYAFDVLSSDSSENAAVFVLQGAHERNVSSIGVSPSGNALATASWDSSLKIWA
jgi:WD40 repeat protein